MQTLKFRNILLAQDISQSVYVLQNFDPNKGTSTKETDTNVGRDGINIINAYYDERSVTAKGVIVAASFSELCAFRRNLTQVCDGKTQDFLYFTTGGTVYKSPALAELPDFGSVKGNTLEFNIEFILPKFYWYGAEENTPSLFKQENFLKTEFTLPLILTERTNGAQVINVGDVETPFVLEIYSDTVSETGGGLEIFNATTNEKLILNYSVLQGETVKIDTEEMTITSSRNGNISRYLDKTSSFFSIKVGKNQIVAVNTNTDNHVIATLKYYNRYIGV